ncbi:hypothetical protein M407DRAFT_25554 [Tulasnella calospora MUT 4182]|uniref:F-box domain-containing protein n=1 Tax=Tulasnella calospora MUT 4182 TaxID=1051891 RepID=A0A0C3QFX6_9AGAM|nr:hypothetical protein M407DRAFT_25554 [Tulasnella calospora MUT 4182]
MLWSFNSRPTNPVARVNNGGNPVAPYRAAAINQQKSLISQLPTETLTSIIHWALPYAGFTSIDEADTPRVYMRKLYILRQVSKRWHGVIDGTPSFWTVLHSTLPPHVNNATIVRSASCPLAVVYKVPWDPDIHYHPSPEGFLRTIDHTRYRWSTVALDICGDEGMSEYLATPAPLLRTVITRSYWEDEVTMEPLELLGGQTANLRHVQVEAASLQWRTGLFSELRSLSLTKVDLIVSQVIDFLHTSPDLEELCINGNLEMPTSQTPASMITLSHLRSIQLACDRSGVVDYILQHIRLPSCLTFDVSLGDEDDYAFDYPRFMDETMEPFCGMLREIHIGNGGSKMSAEDHAFRWQSLNEADRGRGFSINIQAFCPMGIRWVGQTLQEESGLEVEFPSFAALGDVLTNLAPLRCVTRVRIPRQGYAQSTEEILQFLRQPLSPSVSTPSLPCLRELLITWTGWDVQALLDMVQQRCSAFSRPTLDQTPLIIKIEHEVVWFYSTPLPILDLATLSKIRGNEGVECFQFTKRKGNSMLSSVNFRPANPVATANNGGSLVPPHRATINQQESPIFQLPTETLTSIIHWALPYAGFTSINEAIDSSWEYMRKLYILRRVSKRWYDVIDGTPSFWTVLLSTLPSHVNGATVVRSASRPLAIVFEHPEEPNIDDHPSPEEFLGTVGPTRSRWSAVALDTFDDEGISEYLATSAPLLHTVVIRNEWNYWVTMEPLELLGGQAANLRHVDVSCALLQWRTGLFSELKSLSLTQVDLMVGQVIDFLHASPDLEELCIDGYFEMPISQTSASIITLSHLKSIRLECDISAAAVSILQQIRLPSCLMFDVSLGDEDEDDFDYSRFMDETMDPFCGMLRETHIENGGSKMSVDHRVFRWISLTGPDRRRFFSIFIQAFCLVGVHWVGQTLREESGLQVEFPYNAVLGDVLRDLAPLRCVTRVLVTQSDARITHEILRFLRQPLGPGASAPSLPCLRELLITSTGWDVQALLDMVQQRCTAFPAPTLDQPPLAIKIEPGTFSWYYGPRPIIELATLVKIRGTEGVECFQFVGKRDADGTLAITWNEETSEPTGGY